MEEQSQQAPLLAEFDPRVQEDVDGLMWLGHLEEEFEFAGHHFVIRTLKASEELAAGLVAKKYVDTFGQAKAYAWSKVALALRVVDYREDFCPSVGPDAEAYARARFNYCVQRWYWPLGEYLFARLTDLERRQVEAIQAVQSLSTGSPQSYTPYADSSTDQGDSPETSPPSTSDSSSSS